MRVLLRAPRQNLFARALCRELRSRGHSPRFSLETLWRASLKTTDILLVKGARQPQVIKAFSHIPTFVFDWGYFARVNSPEEHGTGHWQISYRSLNRPPRFPCPRDRFDKTGLALKPSRSGGDYVLVIGQKPGDAAIAGVDHRRWLLDQIANYRAAGHVVRYREHPRGGYSLPGEKSLGGPIDEALAGAKLVVTHNSNAGHEALIAGVPVVCSPCAPYAELSGEECPSIERRMEYFSRAAYGQWKVSEASEAVDFLFSRWLPHIREREQCTQ